MKKILYIIIIALISIFPLSAQYVGQWGMHVESNATLAVGELREWFVAGYQVELGIGQQQDSPWFIEALFDYSSFSKMHYITTSAAEVVEEIPLSLSYIGFMAQGKYTLSSNNFKPYISIAGGPHFWVGSRGEITENTELAIPNIPERVLSEWNMGIKAGIGAELMIGDMFSIDAGLSYRLVIGSLWPTMQEHVELEAVNGFSSIALRIRTNIYF
ncbi:MAG: hypothetical protein WCT23_00665 [Candidatus Neomarinimicrobiota bacterium]